MAAAVAVSFSACSSGGVSPMALVAKQQLRQQDRESAVKPSVSATNQTSDGFSVIVTGVNYPKSAVSDTSANEGVLTVAPLVNGNPGDVAGFTVVRQGTSTDTTVPIQVQLRSGAYRVALYSGDKSPSNAQQPLAGTDVTVTVS